jgi:hypothetical protein
MNETAPAGRPWIVHLFTDVVGWFATREGGQAHVDRLARNGVATVANPATGERWLRAGGTWRPIETPPPGPAARARYAADAALEDLGGKRRPQRERSIEERTAAAQAARLPYKDD